MSPRDKTDKERSAERAADTNADYTPKATSRELGKNSRGEATIYPSDVASVSTQYNLTSPEAERLILGGDLSEGAANRIKEERVVYRQSYEVVEGAVSNPLAVADARRAEAEAAAAEDTGAAADRIAADKTQPQAGPYGPNATYDKVAAPVDADHGRVVVETNTKVVGS